MTTKKLLQAKGDELSRLLGEVLQPSNCKVDVNRNKYLMRKYKYYCNTCRRWINNKEEHLKADPIPLDDWNIAMKFYRDSEHSCDNLKLTPRDLAILEWFENLSDTDGLPVFKILPERVRAEAAKKYLLDHGKPEDFLTIAAICKLKGK